MQELSESQDTNAEHNHVNEDNDEEIKSLRWQDFTNEAVNTPDDTFRREFVARALAENPKILQSMLEAVTDESELQDEIYKAIDDIRKSRSRSQR